MMQVTNRFQALQYLKKLPEDFYAVRVDVESLKDNSLRKLCRDLEKQLEVQQANLENDREFYEGYLKTLLDKEGFNTRDLSISLIVLGNKHGFLSGRIFNQGDFQKRIIDVKQFNDSYPIFIDTSTMKFLETGKTSDQIKREREETFSHDPEPKLIRVETINDLQAALAEQEIDYNKQIDDLKAKYHAAEETNQQLIQAATQNENTLMSQVNELRQINEAANQNQENLVNQINALQSKVQQLKQGSNITKKVVDFYIFTQSNTIGQGQKAMESDPIAFKLIKDKMVKAMPNRLVPEFKRRIEGKTKLPEMFMAVLEMREQFPETEMFEPDYNETNLNVLKQQRKPDWTKNVKCFHCGKKGHIKKNCYKRESKTKKSGISWKDKKSQK